MAKIIFYEKPGCATNARQRRALEAEGHEVIARNLLTEPWTAARLSGFFGQMPIAFWFNPAAPAVKSGAVDPATLTAEAALAAMLADPLLIRRPLLEANGVGCAGFELERLGLSAPDTGGRDLQGCSRPAAGTPCPAPAEPPP